MWETFTSGATFKGLWDTAHGPNGQNQNVPCSWKCSIWKLKRIKQINQTENVVEKRNGCARDGVIDGGPSPMRKINVWPHRWLADVHFESNERFSNDFGSDQLSKKRFLAWWDVLFFSQKNFDYNNPISINVQVCSFDLELSSKYDVLLLLF